jgi:hypothetical protein
MKKILAVLLSMLMCAPAYGQGFGGMFPGPGTPHTTGGGGYVGPGDLASFTVWYGARALNASIAAGGTQKLFRAARASDSHECDFIVATSGGVGNSANCSTGGDNGQSLSTWLTSTTGSLRTWYDQAGGGYDGGQTTNQPTVTISCSGSSKPCIANTGSAYVSVATAPAVSQGYSVSAVAMRTSVTGYANIWHGAGSGFSSAQLGFRSASGQVFVGNDEVTGAAAESAQHAVNGVLNGASSVINIDGTETTSTVSSGGTDTSWCLFNFNCSGLSELVGNISEFGLKAGVLTGSERTAICNNQHSYYGISGTC